MLVVRIYLLSDWANPSAVWLVSPSECRWHFPYVTQSCEDAADALQLQLHVCVFHVPSSLYILCILASVGKVLVFLDSHCEVNEMWLQPLLTPIKEDRRTVVCPVIDIISADTLTYSSSPVVRGGFNWGLHFKWDLVPLSELEGPEGATAPIK